MDSGFSAFVRGLRSARSIDDILHFVLREATLLLDAERAMFAVCDAEGRVRMGVRHNMPLHEDEAGRPFSGGLIQRVLSERRSVVVDDVRTSIDFNSRESVKLNDIRRMMGAPLLSPDEDILGVLYIDNTGRSAIAASDETTARLEMLADLSALALRNAQATEEGQYRNRMMAAYAHHVRGAIQVIRNNADFLSRPSSLNPDAQDAIDSIKRMSDELTTLSTSAVELHRLESSASTPAIHLDPAAELKERAECLDPVAQSITGHRIDVQGEGAPMVHTDRARFGMAVDELLLNAIKYSPSTEPVRVDIHPSERPESTPRSTSVGPMHRLHRLRATSTAGFVRVTITNANKSGPIPAERIGQLFEPYVRGTDPSWAGYSSGLGLSVVKELADSLGGAVSVVSNDDHTAFSIDLPTETEAETESRRPTSTAARVDRMPRPL